MLKEGYLWHRIFRHVPPVDLLMVSRTCNNWCELARADESWVLHKTRVLEQRPFLQPLFDQFEPTGKRVKRIVKRRRASVAPKGSWYVFVHFLMMDSLVDKVSSFRREPKWKIELVVRAVCNCEEATVTINGERVGGFRAFRYNTDGGWDSVQYYWFQNFGSFVKAHLEGQNTRFTCENGSFVLTRDFAKLVLCRE